MRNRLIAWSSVVALASCSSAPEPERGFGLQDFGTAFVDTDGDGLPDTRRAGFENARSAAFVDTNEDGVPDARRSLLSPDPGGDHAARRALGEREVTICQERVDLCARRVATVRAAVDAGQRPDDGIVTAQLQLADARLDLIAAERRLLALRTGAR